ncbi:MAG TPA: hypothetical protein VH041_00935 [Caldimonas sp.]|nr:hypothetical protein [Caldimonas sp.]HEX4232844.1 hypothetical protein [Caldimonas sp.]
MAVQATDSSGAAVPATSLTWETADATLATVDEGGVVRPLRVGFTTIKVSADGISASGTLSVRGTTRIPARSRYVGMNLAGIAYYSSEFPFADMMKSGMGWVSREDNGTWGTAFPSLTADGYPAALAPGQHALDAVAWTGSHFTPGRYVVLWDGDGSISFPLSNVTVAESASNRIAIDVVDTSGSLWVAIDRTSATNPVRNVRFLWPGTEATYASVPFNPVFLAKIAPFSLLRYMDWGATNGSPVVEWADRAHTGDVTYATAAGVPIEVMIDLANTLHVDPWFCVPHQASDDYVRQFATLLHDRLDPALHPHIEYSNEVWNTGFPQGVWANSRSQALGLDSPFGQPAIFYAVRAVQVFKIVQDVWGVDRDRIVRVLAGQAAWDNFLTHALAYQDTAANADVMAIAPYFSAAAAGDPAQVATTLTLSSDQIVDQMLANIRGDIKASMTTNAALAANYKLKLKAYESGAGDSSSYFPADKVDAMTALFVSAHNNPRMRDVYAEYYGQWVAAGGDTMNQFNDVGGWSKWGLWGSLQYVTEDPAASPKYQGLLDFIAAHPTTP